LFNAQGLEFTEIALTQPDAVAGLNTVLQSGRIAFAFSFMALGVALTFKSDAGESSNLWEKLGIPFLALYGDSPAYYFDRHVLPGPNFAAIYGFPEHAALRNRLPKINAPVSCMGPVLLDGIAPDEVDFRQKAQGKLIFLKNGNDPEALRRSWRSLLTPGPLRALEEMASQLATDLNDGRLNQIDDQVLEYCGTQGIGIESLPKLRLFFIAQLDDYIRRLKSTLLARAMMDFPVEIRGTGWEHLDFAGKRAVLVDDCDYAQSRQLIRDALGVVDMSPNTSLAPHDRFARALGSHTLCLGNAQDFLARDVPEHAQLSFRFETESIQARIAEALAHPARHVELGRHVAREFSAKNPPEAGVAQMVRTAQCLRLNQTSQRPHGIAPYFVWPPVALQ
jgi:hypothetical protein